MDYYPMCWTAKYDEKKLRAYLDAHPGVKYLLGFNEPNFMYQANLTPKDAAAKWPKVEKIAEDYNLRLVAPVLNFTGDHVGGRAWTPLEWIDEFIKQYKQKNKRQVYVHMSAFDKDYFYAPGSRIPAKDYVDATTDDRQVRLRPNTEEGSDVPLQVEFQKGSAAAYQIEVPQDGTYKITLHCLAATETALGITADEWQTTRAVTVSTNGKWIDVEDNITLAAGRHTLRMANLGDASFLINSWTFAAE